jgi:hypothetical protein
MPLSAIAAKRIQVLNGWMDPCLYSPILSCAYYGCWVYKCVSYTHAQVLLGKTVGRCMKPLLHAYRMPIARACSCTNNVRQTLLHFSIDLLILSAYPLKPTERAQGMVTCTTAR